MNHRIKLIQDLEVCGQRIRTCTYKTQNESTPLLICNGFGVSSELLEPLVEAMGEKTIILFDAPGTGESSTPLLPYSMFRLAAMLDRLLSRLGYNQVDIMGISWGGAVAQELALNHPRRCRRLILAATTTGILSIPGNPLSIAMLANPLRWLGKGSLSRNAGRLYGGDFRSAETRSRVRVPHMIMRNPLGTLWQMAAIGAWTSVPRLAMIRQPTLLLAGEDDPLVPLVNARLMLKLIPDAQLETFDCGHMFPLTRAKAVAARISTFAA